MVREEGVYGILNMRFDVSFPVPVCKRTRRDVSSANFASRIFDGEGKESEHVA